MSIVYEHCILYINKFKCKWYYYFARHDKNNTWKIIITNTYFKKFYNASLPQLIEIKYKWYYYSAWHNKNNTSASLPYRLACAGIIFVVPCILKGA